MEKPKKFRRLDKNRAEATLGVAMCSKISLKTALYGPLLGRTPKLIGPGR